MLPPCRRIWMLVWRLPASFASRLQDILFVVRRVVGLPARPPSVLPRGVPGKAEPLTGLWKTQHWHFNPSRGAPSCASVRIEIPAGSRLLLPQQSHCNFMPSALPTAAFFGNAFRTSATGPEGPALLRVCSTLTIPDSPTRPNAKRCFSNPSPSRRFMFQKMQFKATLSWARRLGRAVSRRQRSCLSKPLKLGMSGGYVLRMLVSLQNSKGSSAELPCRQAGHLFREAGFPVQSFSRGQPAGGSWNYSLHLFPPELPWKCPAFSKMWLQGS